MPHPCFSSLIGDVFPPSKKIIFGENVLWAVFILRDKKTTNGNFNYVMTFFATDPRKESPEMFSRITSEIR